MTARTLIESKAWYLASVAAVTLFAALGLWQSATYTLYLPHPVGHLKPAGMVVVAIAWIGYGFLLPGRSTGKPGGVALLLPLGLAVASALVCHHRYGLQL